MDRIAIRQRVARRSFMLLAVSLAGFFAGSGVRADSLSLLRPIADAYVISDPNLLDTNFGADFQIIAWANYPYFGGRSYVAFDLSGIPAGETVTWARLNLFQWNGGGYASGIDLFRVEDDAWDEDTITWNNQPLLSPTLDELIAQDPTLVGYARGWVSFDLLELGVWDPAVDLTAGDGKLTLIVRITGGELNTQRSHNFCSREGDALDCLIAGEPGPGPGRAPQLVIGTPEPEAAATLGAGLATLAALAARRTRRDPGRQGRRSEPRPDRPAPDGDRVSCRHGG